MTKIPKLISVIGFQPKKLLEIREIFYNMILTMELSLNPLSFHSPYQVLTLFLSHFPKHVKFSIRVSLENKVELVINCLDEVVN